MRNFPAPAEGSSSLSPARVEARLEAFIERLGRGSIAGLGIAASIEVGRNWMSAGEPNKRRLSVHIDGFSLHAGVLGAPVAAVGAATGASLGAAVSLLVAPLAMQRLELE